MVNKPPPGPTPGPPPGTPGPMQLPETWSATAPGYAEEIVRHAALYAEEALRLVPLRPEARVLDVATGPGTLALLAARRAASVVAVDFAPGMVEELKLLAARSGVRNV